MKKLFALTLLVIFVFQLNINGQETTNGIIRSGILKMEVKNYQHVKRKIDSLVASRNGYIAREQESNYKTKIQNVVTIRVPNENFIKLNNEVSQLARKVNEKEVKIIDVKKEKESIQKQIESKQEVKEKYIQMVNKAKLIDDINRAEEQITKINQEIARLRGRLNNLNDPAYSTLVVDMYQFYHMKAGKQEQSAFDDLSRDKMKNLFRTILLFSIIPVVLILGGYILYRRYKRIHRRKKREKKGYKSPW